MCQGSYRVVNSWKSLEICSNFPDVEKVWKMEIKSEKMLKSFEFFSKLQQVLCKWIFFHFGQILSKSNLVCIFPAFFEASIDHLLILITLSLEKVLNFGSKKLNKPCYVYFILLSCFCFFDRLFTILWILILAGFLQVCTQAAQTHVTRRSLVINSDNQRLGSTSDLWIDDQNVVAQTLCFT